MSTELQTGECVTLEEADDANPPGEASPVAAPRWRPAAEPTCCGSGCDDCPF